MSRSFEGFTLIELIVVIAVLVTLASLILAGSSVVRRSAWDADTRFRLQSLESAIVAYQQSADGVYRLQKVGIGSDVSWGSLRSVLDTMRRGRTWADFTPTYRPPNVSFLWFGWGNTDGGDSAYLGKTNVDFRLDTVVRWAARTDATTARNEVQSPIGESLDRTREVMPAPHWGSAYTITTFRAEWPRLVETGTGPSIVHSAWPAADWDQATPGTVPPIWEWPWGERIISRSSASPVDLRQSRNLGQLSPIRSSEILQAIGILSPGSEGTNAYRTDRSTKAPWNDRWGNPLVVSFAIFMPARYDWNSAATTPWPLAEQSDGLLGGRDLFLTKSREFYGYDRALYFGVGAVGPVLDEELPVSWSDGVVNRQTLRTLWKQIAVNCSAADWTQDSFADPPWSGVRIGTSDEDRSYLAIPITITNAR